MLIINENDFGLNDLAGLALTYTQGQTLPRDLYVYGLQDGYDFDAYLDPEMSFVNRISEFIEGRGIRCSVGLPTRPRSRPAMGLVRRLRSPQNIVLATRLAVFVLFAINERVAYGEQLVGFFPAGTITPAIGDLVRLPTGTGFIAGFGNDPLLRVANPDGTHAWMNPADMQLMPPNATGQRVRPVRNSPWSNGHNARRRGITTTDTGIVTALDPQWIRYLAQEKQLEVTVDPGELVRVS
jgi:hypothetical protein